MDSINKFKKCLLYIWVNSGYTDIPKGATIEPWKDLNTPFTHPQMDEDQLYEIHMIQEIQDYGDFDSFVNHTMLGEDEIKGLYENLIELMLTKDIEIENL